MRKKHGILAIPSGQRLRPGSELTEEGRGILQKCSRLRGDYPERISGAREGRSAVGQKQCFGTNELDLIDSC